MQNNFQDTKLPTAASTGGTFPWSNPSRITADDGSSATLSPGGSTSGTITGESFAFTDLPDSAVIDGIGVFIDGSESSASSEMSLSIGGADTLTANFGDETGGSDNLWGLNEITKADLASLSVTILTETFGAGGVASIDYIAVTIYWHIDMSTDSADVPTRVAYKVYTKDGNYLGELPNVTSDLAFPEDINSAGTSIEIVCAKYVDNEVIVSPLLTEAGEEITTEDDQPILGTSTDLLVTTGDSPDAAIFKNSNRIKAWMYNKYHPNGKLMFSGQVNRVKFKYGGGDATVRLTVYSDGLDLNRYILTPSSSYSYTDDVSQTTQDTFSTVSSYSPVPAKGEVTNWFYVGQTFKTGSISLLGAVSLMVKGSGSAVLTLRSGLSGIALGSVAFEVNNASPKVIDVVFSTPIEVTSNTTYFLTIESVANSGSIDVYRTTSNPYGEGEAYKSEDGSSGYVALGGDLYFVTKSASAGNTTTTYSSKDPVTDMMSSALADYNERGGNVREREFIATGLSLTYIFNTAYIYDVMKKALELSPSGYYAYVDVGTAEMDIKPVSSTPDFSVVRGRHLDELEIDLTIEQVMNYLLFSGGETGSGNLLRYYQDTKSSANFGLRTGTKSDNRVVLTDTANAIGETFIEENASEEQETSLTVLNENIDITLLTPGKTIGFKNFGNFIDDMVLQVVRREANYDKGIATLTLGRLPIRMNDEVQKINRGLLDEQTVNNPSSPS